MQKRKDELLTYYYLSSIHSNKQMQIKTNKQKKSTLCLIRFNYCLPNLYSSHCYVTKCHFFSQELRLSSQAFTLDFSVLKNSRN